MSSPTTGKFEFEFGDFGPRMSLRAPWEPWMGDELIKNSIVEIELNTGKGWSGKNLDFLSQFSDQLIACRVVGIASSLESIVAVSDLKRLRSLSLFSYCKKPPDFSQFADLETCDYEWIANSQQLLKCHKLEDLFINRYSGRDSGAFSSLTRLTSLRIYNSPLNSIEGFRTLRNLKRLSLANCRQIKSLSGLENFENLEDLDLTGCSGLDSIEEVSSLQNLRKLIISNCKEIRSLKPVVPLRKLRMLLFTDSTNILDGDLSILNSYEHPITSGFRNRKHYSHKWIYLPDGEKCIVSNT